MARDQYETYGRCIICCVALGAQTYANNVARVTKHGRGCLLSCGGCTGHLPIPYEEWTGRLSGRGPEKWHGSG
jgi:hypothetical protein